MAFDFKKISEYRGIFTVLAKFDENCNGNEVRSYADIVRKDSYEAPIDAYLIMINPGSCKIKEKDAVDASKYNYYKGKDVVEAVSDPAQKCVMGFMDLCNLDKVRILNLLDYRNGSFSETLSKKDEIKEEMSIFSPKREDERKKIMSEKAVVIAAWGTDKRLSGLKIQALNTLRGEKIIGVRPKDVKNDYDYKYIKPPRKALQIEVIEDLVSRYEAYKRNILIEK